MNNVTRLLQRHRSIRKFKPDEVSEQVLEAIVRSAQMASTSSNVQAYSVIAVTNPETKRALSAVAGNQQHVESCPVLLVWCADLSRDKLACEREGVEMVSGTMENFIVATVDVALAAQNAAIAAESLGLGIVYIGGIRNNLREATRLLNLPKLVYPVFGMCLGYPDHESGVRPRLPLRAVLHRETYDETAQAESIDEYDRRTRDYYIERTGGKRDTTWSKEMADKFKRPARAYMRAYLEEQGFRFD
ncbi:oxygen-insensitive NADPH nitroreductase [Paenibacillus hemerocallicola]|uniref:Oxygen-insensitive NADPH nitroreductase n=1 Tax=Paenibacillus hemerocallicola TaxID=1172614 RepID=A0A5C4SZL3_9BACL|nr:oxygen-insensitive NADPH nitroreductase [Paenibacillus hemerocallicola]TNJ62288.1 oxygen-insensitive NADPH nitroreductase [Paenibacillus hemerocallicola]